MAHRLTEEQWRPLEAAHHARVDAVTAAHLSRRHDARKHPVEDFLFTYYTHRPAQLRRWHPGPGSRSKVQPSAPTGSSTGMPMAPLAWTSRPFSRLARPPFGSSATC